MLIQYISGLMRHHYITGSCTHISPSSCVNMSQCRCSPFTQFPLISPLKNVNIHKNVHMTISIWNLYIFKKSIMRNQIHSFIFFKHVWNQLGYIEKQEVTWVLQKDLTHSDKEWFWKMQIWGFYTSHKRNTSGKQGLSVNLLEIPKYCVPVCMMTHMYYILTVN